jgi:DNA ligase-1
MSQAQLLTNSIPEDVSGWWVSEKYDGIRAIWQGSYFMTRQGKRLNAPAWFTAKMPKNARLDGELWMGRGTFNELQSNLQTKDSDWAGIKFMVFDLAEEGTFEDRYAKLLATRLPAHVQVVEHIKCASNKALDTHERIVVDAGGEGLVIRRPQSQYRPGRMGDVIKIKRITPDLDRWQG